MRRLPTIIGAGLVAAATASAIAVTSGSAQAPGERTLTFVERETNTFVLADVPPLAAKPSPSKGDTLLFKNTVLDATGTTKVGTSRLAAPSFGRPRTSTARGRSATGPTHSATA